MGRKSENSSKNCYFLVHSCITSYDSVYYTFNERTKMQT